MQSYYLPILRSLSGLSVNISAAWFAATFIGTSIDFPQELPRIQTLMLSVGFGIVFLIAAVLIEKELENG